MRPGVVTRDELMMVLWNTDEFVSDGTLTTMVSRLRKNARTGKRRQGYQNKERDGILYTMKEIRRDIGLFLLPALAYNLYFLFADGTCSRYWISDLSGYSAGRMFYLLI